MKHPTARQWQIARERAARPFWDCPSVSDFAEEIETGWHDEGPAVQNALAEVMGEPPAPLQPSGRSIMPHASGANVEFSAATIVVVVAGLIVAGTLLMIVLA